MRISWRQAPTATLKSHGTVDEMQIDLTTGRVDAGLADASALQGFLDKPEGADFQFVPLNITSTYDPTLGEGIRFGMRQYDTELKADIDTALCELIKDGSIKASSEK